MLATTSLSVTGRLLAPVPAPSMLDRFQMFWLRPLPGRQEMEVSQMEVGTLPPPPDGSLRLDLRPRRQPLNLISRLVCSRLCSV